MKIICNMTFGKFGLTRTQYCLYCLFFLLLTITGQSVYSQVCDPEIKPVKGWELQYRERKDRCEGFYIAHPVGKILLVVQLDETSPAIMDNYSGIGSGPSTVPEPSTLLLLGLGIVALVGWRRFRKYA